MSGSFTAPKRKSRKSSAAALFVVANHGKCITDAVLTIGTIHLQPQRFQVAMRASTPPTTPSTRAVTWSQKTSYPAHRHPDLARRTSPRLPPPILPVTRQPYQLCGLFPFGHRVLPRQRDLTTPASGPLTAALRPARVHLIRRSPPGCSHPPMTLVTTVLLEQSATG